MSPTEDFFVRFWGVRGSVATPGADTMVYGGNTSCIEIRCGKNPLIFDAGTGLRNLGDCLSAEGVKDLDLFLTHTHIDHIAGFPFFSHAFKPGNSLRVWSGHLDDGLTTEGVLRQFMSAPLWPVPIDIFRADVSYNDFHAGETLIPCEGATLRTTQLNHPQNATGYRIDYSGKAICYITDTEQHEDSLDSNILGLIDGADIVIYDSTYTDGEYLDHKGWGHSTWQEGVRLCDAGSVGRLVIFHHMPERNDADLDLIAKEAEESRPGTIVAREGMTLSP